MLPILFPFKMDTRLISNDFTHYRLGCIYPFKMRLYVPASPNLKTFYKKQLSNFQSMKEKITTKEWKVKERYSIEEDIDL